MQKELQRKKKNFAKKIIINAWLRSPSSPVCNDVGGVVWLRSVDKESSISVLFSQDLLGLRERLDTSMQPSCVRLDQKEKNAKEH